MKRLWIFSFLVALGMTVLSGQALWAASEFKLRSHQATYDMADEPRLVRNWSSVQNASGVMRYQINNTCEGWTVENHTALLLDYGNGPPVEMRWSYTSYETHDGEQFQFRSRTLRGDQEIENLQGTVNLKGDQMVLTYKRPEGAEEILPRDIQFPTQVMIRSIEVAKSGQSLFSTPYFDGSGQDLDMFVSVFSAPSKSLSASRLVEVDVDNSPLWDVDMAFYAPDVTSDLPELEITAKMREDGITTELFQDFADFSMKGTLKSLKLFEEPDCK